MGTRFIFSTKKSVGGFSIKLRHKGIWLGKSNTQNISKMVVRAKAMLSTTIAAISCGPDKTMRDYADTYFLTNGGPSQGEWNNIMAIYELIYHGLGNDVTLKLGADGAHGYVTASVLQPGTPGGVIDSDGDTISYSGHTLHVSKKSLLKGEELGTVTIIHEASHKYANTYDFDWAGYRKEDDSGFEAPGLTKAQALQNADSYAYFCYRVGAARGV